MDLSLLFAGTGGALPTADRAPAVTLLRRGGESLLIGCGEGTQRQLMRSAGLVDVDCILLPTLAPRHRLGLPGMVKSFELRDRTAPLTLAGPHGTQRLLATVEAAFGRVRFEVEAIDLSPGDALEFDDHQIVCADDGHGGLAFALVEPDRPGRLDAERAERLGVTPGPDLGRLQRGEAVGGVRPEQVMGPPRPGRRIVLAGPDSPPAFTTQADLWVCDEEPTTVLRVPGGGELHPEDLDLVEVPLRDADERPWAAIVLASARPVARGPGSGATPEHGVPAPAAPGPDVALRLTFLGTGGSVPSARRGLPATLVQGAGGARLLVDCGEGTTRQLLRAGHPLDLDAVVITHLHADHWLGLPGLLLALARDGRTRPLTLQAPKGTTALLTRLGVPADALPFPVDVRGHPDDRDEPLEIGDLHVLAFPVDHRIPTHGLVLTSLQAGAPRVVLSADTAPCEATRAAALDADVLVHEATFLHEDRVRAAETRHSTARQAAELAADAGVRTLVLTHVSQRYPGGRVRDEAREHFPGAELPRDLDHLDVPAAGHGPPALVRRPRGVAAGGAGSL